MNSKQQILARIRKELPQAVELPSLEQDWIQYEDVQSQFIEAVAAVGGESFVVSSATEMQRQLDQLEHFRSARVRCSLVEGVGNPNLDLQSLSDPHELENCDWAILPAELGVAENGAVWMTDARLKHRVLPFISQHLAIVVPANAIVHNMAEAYARIGDFAVGTHPPSLGVFISGPSKTADIEQSLVIGAHGARSLILFLLQE